MAEPTPAPVGTSSVHTQLFAQAASVQRGRAAKGDHGIFGQVFAVFHRVNACCVGHVFVDDFGQTEGCFAASMSKRSPKWDVKRFRDCRHASD